MFIFGKMCDWEEDALVKQVLVFPDFRMRQEFQINLDQPDRPKTMSGFPDENGIGAIYKLRAVKTSDENWVAVIRCGFTGHQQFESAERFLDPVEALHFAKNWLLKSIISSFDVDFERAGKDRS